MRRRSLFACTAVVLIAHGALIETLTRHALPQPVDPARRSPGRLVLLDRDTITALMPPAAAVPATSPTPLQTAAVATPAISADAASAPRANTRSAPAIRGPGMVVYRPPAELDVPLRPRSAPDLAMLENLPWSGLPIRLRLFIDSQGNVLDTQVLQSVETPDVVARVRKMFLATGFTQGLVHGEPASSYKDIEITVGTPH